MSSSAFASISATFASKEGRRESSFDGVCTGLVITSFDGVCTGLIITSFSSAFGLAGAGALGASF